MNEGLCVLNFVFHGRNEGGVVSVRSQEQMV
jgi:hypothetical protein